MEDEELQAIRAARLQQLQRSAGAGGSSSHGAPTQPKGSGASQVSMMMSQLLEPEAYERLSRVRLVKPERASAVEQHLMKLYQAGAIRRKISENQIVDILEKVASDERKQGSTTIVFDRRDKSGEGDDDDFFD